MADLAEGRDVDEEATGCGVGMRDEGDDDDGEEEDRQE